MLSEYNYFDFLGYINCLQQEVADVEQVPANIYGVADFISEKDSLQPEFAIINKIFYKFYYRLFTYANNQVLGVRKKNNLLRLSNFWQQNFTGDVYFEVVPERCELAEPAGVDKGCDLVLGNYINAASLRIKIFIYTQQQFQQYLYCIKKHACYDCYGSVKTKVHLLAPHLQNTGNSLGSNSFLSSQSREVVYWQQLK